MRRYLGKCVILTVILAALSGCGSKNVQASSGETGNAPEEQTEYEFEGTITEIFGTGANVKVDEGFPIRASGELVSVSLAEDADSAQIGDRVRVVYSGNVMETSPLQLGNQRSIQVIEKQNAEEEETGEEEVNHFPGVSMTLVDVSRTGARVEFLNETDLQVEFGEEYRLQAPGNGGWEDVPYKADDAAFHSIGYTMPKGQPVEWEADWEWLYGTLEPGHYRLVKEVMDFRGTGDYTNYRLAAEFEIGADQEGQTILQQPPVLVLQDSLSSTYETFEATAGNYTWHSRTENEGEMSGIAACGSAPLEEGKERNPLKLQSYNKMDSVPFLASWEVMPDRAEVNEYDSGDIGNTEAEALSTTVCDGTFFLELRPGRLYAIEAEWLEDGLEDRGFYGAATYVVVTE